MFEALDIGATGLTAQRTRMDVLAIGPFLVVKPSGNAEVE